MNVVESLVRLPFDVLCRRKVNRIAADIYRIRILIHTDPVNLHHSRERQMLKVDETEVLGKPQVDDEVLSVRSLVKYVFYNRLQNVP